MGPMDDVATELMELAGGDPFASVWAASESHREVHGCWLHSAGPEVMQLAASYVRAAGARSVLDLGCGLGYSTLWLADAVGEGGQVIGIDSDADHVSEARRLADGTGFEDRVRFMVGHVADVLEGLEGPVDAVHDDAWFARTPDHLGVMLRLLRPGGVLTMPNWCLLVDAITGEERNDWQSFAGPTWAADTRRYADLLAGRQVLSVNWITQPPLGVAVKAASR